MKRVLISAALLVAGAVLAWPQGTRLLRQPSLSETHIAFTYGGDIWVYALDGETRPLRITSTPAVESDPHFSPDGKWIAFSSNRSGNTDVYTVPLEGGEPTRLTWYPSGAYARGWTPDGSKVLFATSRETAPSGFNRLWTISTEGGPAKLLTPQWGNSGSFASDGRRIVIDRMSRWDVEWRDYRGGQNTPLVILDLKDTTEVMLPNASTTDILPLWMGEKIYFLSDRDWTANIWAYSPAGEALEQVTRFTGSDVKWVAGNGKMLAFEREGFLHLYDPSSGEDRQLEINIQGDFPWAATQWEDVSKSIRAISLSATGKRAILETRGEIFTVPVEHGDPRNITRSSGVADRFPVWSPKGDSIAWFSDKGGKGYSLMIGDQDGLSEPRMISIGRSKLGWEPAWSPDGKWIAFTDDDALVRLVEVSSGEVTTIDTAGTNLERGNMGLIWSPDSRWLAYARAGSNYLRQIIVWSVQEHQGHAITNDLADSHHPVWDLDLKHLYFLASTDVALGSGWANTSAMTSDPEYAVYLVNLREEDPTPFKLRSDEEEGKKEKAEGEDDGEKASGEKSRKKSTKKEEEEESSDTVEVKEVTIDFEGIVRRIIPLPMPERNYRQLISGPEGHLFIAESVPNSSGMTLHKFSLEDRKAEEFATGVGSVSVSADGKKLLARVGGSWKVMDATKSKSSDEKTLSMDLKVLLDRQAEWKQIFEEAWRYERDYFYAPNLHGRDWDVVHERYAPLIPYVKHRTDLTYILDQMNGELSVGHSFVGGGDYPDVASSVMGLLGADLVPENGRWKIERIYTTESWNPGLSSPLDKPGVKIKAGDYLVGINGVELTGEDNIYEQLDGTAGHQTVLHINDKPSFEGAWKETVEPIRSEYALRQRAWVEDNRRRVDSLSGGRLAYVWVPNTGTPGLVSFNRYFFAQQEKEGAVIDERFNGGGLLDDYMVDLMTRSLRAAITNEVPGGKPMVLPAGILGPKVLLINERAGSGGDFFPWVFRQQQAGPLIGKRTWGGLVASSVHYLMVDGGYLTAPDNAVFDPVHHRWIAENEGVPPDIEVYQDARSLSEGRDPQLERAVQELLKKLGEEAPLKITPPPYSTPAIQPDNDTP
ncbi:MAG: S41 family peptidase [Bacteroidales bacterium]